jgi:uncharacterized protein
MSISRRKLLGSAAASAVLTMPPFLDTFQATQPASGDISVPIGVVDERRSLNGPENRIVDIHVHFDEKNPAYLEEFLRVSERLNLTACMLTPFANRKVVAEAAKKYPRQIVPFGFVELDAPDVVKQVEELHSLGFRGLGEMEFVKKPYNDPSYFPVYELANRYAWIMMYHTGIVLRAKFDEPEDVASGRMRPIHLEEIARRFPRITVIGAHCGNPEYEWAAEIARWNSNVFFDLSGSTLTKMHSRLADFKRIFWWSGQPQDSKTPNDDPSAFVKIVFGSDTELRNIEGVKAQYHAMFDACDVPESTRKMIMGGTLSMMLGLHA